MKRTDKKHFIKEVEAAAHGNPNIDMKLVREWQAITKMLEDVPPPPESEPNVPVRLQPIPLHMFR